MIFSKLNQNSRWVLLLSLCLALLVNGCSTAPSSKSPTTTAKHEPVVKPYKRPVAQPKPADVKQEAIKTKPKPSVLKTSTAIKKSEKPKPKTAKPVIVKSSPIKTETKALKKPVTKPKVTKTKVVEPVKKKTETTLAKTTPVTQKKITKQPEKIIAQPKPTTPIESPTTKNLAVTLDALPISYQNWVIDKPKANGDICILKTQASKIEDGAGGSPTYIEINNQSLLIKTKSDVDLSYESSQLLINNSSFKYDKVITDTNVIINTNYLDVLNALKASTTATIELGFWPSWPQTHTYQTSISVQGFETAYNAWQHCNKIQ